MKTENKISYNFKGLIKKAFLYIDRALVDGETLGQMSEGLKKLVNEYSDLTKTERYDLYTSAYEVARACKHEKTLEKARFRLTLRKSYDKIHRSARRVKSSSEGRKKAVQLRALLKDSGKVFFLCSKHNSPADDHKAYQGKIYVDRFWRQKVSGEDYYAVLSYIRNHDVKTVQEITGAPVYLTTRPYCKHFFVPVHIRAVLGSSLNRLNKKLELKHREEIYGDKEYYDLRRHVYAVLQQKSPCPQYERMSKK